MKSLENCFQKFIQDLQRHTCEERIFQAAKFFQENHKDILEKVMSYEDNRFLSHGDFWSNNVMYHKSNATSKFHF